MFRKISIGCRYGDLVKIKNFKETDHDKRDDQEEPKEEPKSSLSPQIDTKRKKLLILNLNGFLIRKVHILDHFRRIFVPNRIADYRFRDTLRNILVSQTHLL